MTQPIAWRLSTFVRGLYFIRFAIALWLSPLILVGLDRTSAASITRGILTPETLPQAVSASFMLYSAGVIVLLLVRLVALNGYERFPCELARIDWLHRKLGTPQLPLWLFLCAHFSGFLTGWYLAWNMKQEGVRGFTSAAAWILFGAGLAYLFWLFVGLIYVWSYVPAQFGGRDSPVQLILPNKLRLFPDSWIKLLLAEPPPPLARWLQPFSDLVSTRLGPGYVFSSGGDGGSRILFEGHRFAAVSLFGLLTLYVFLFAFTAPVPLPMANAVCNSFTLAVLLFILSGIALRPWPSITTLRVFKVVVTMLLVASITGLLWIWVNDFHSNHGFAVLGSVLVLVTGFFWLLSTLAFFFDSSRVPVLTGMLFLLLGAKLLPLYHAEHYFTVVKTTTPIPTAPQPKQILLGKMKDKKDPLVIVTAEGGGIHSAAWTASVLMELEKQFYLRNPNKPFHGSVLLVSGVSGGSAGLLPFLREYTSETPFAQVKNDPDTITRRVIDSASCSSLQAVAWGLTYYDVLDFLSLVNLPRFSGITPAGTPPSGDDRSWALERAFDRNLKDGSCFHDPQGSLDPTDFPNMSSGYQMTLGSTADSLRRGVFPAFTFNTTAVETGGRFLLSNYELPPVPSPATPNLQNDLVPAESFLHAFGHDSIALQRCIRKAYADLPLATAVRLSGTFPYVSSASRIPTEISDLGFHFVDGGYFDNDGTSSVAEFLYFALSDNQTIPAGAAKGAKKKPSRSGGGEESSDTSQRGPIPILLVEIRNDWDMDSRDSAESFAAQDHLKQSAGSGVWTLNDQDRPSGWGVDSQLDAPLKGFWNAGHSSDTRRNRRELCMVEKAYRKQIAVHHMVFDYRNSNDRDQPLSWDLTPNDRDNVYCALNPNGSRCESKTDEKNKGDQSIVQLAAAAADWFNEGDFSGMNDEVCESNGRSVATDKEQQSLAKNSPATKTRPRELKSVSRLKSTFTSSEETQAGVQKIEKTQ
jgi:hypothetical protein